MTREAVIETYRCHGEEHRARANQIMDAKKVTQSHSESSVHKKTGVDIDKSKFFEKYKHNWELIQKRSSIQSERATHNLGRWLGCW